MIPFTRPTISGTTEQQVQQLCMWLQGFLPQLTLALSTISEENLSEAARGKLADLENRIRQLEEGNRQ